MHRLDIATGKIETWEPFKNAPKGEPHNIYDVIPDSKNNVYFTDFRQQHVGRIDAKTGEVKLFEVPTVRSAPRRGSMDAQDRLWFGEYRGDRIGMFDTRTEQFREWKLSTRWASPYDVVLDKNENAWTGSMITDQVTWLDTKTGEMVDYCCRNQQTFDEFLSTTRQRQLASGWAAITVLRSSKSNRWTERDSCRWPIVVADVRMSCFLARSQS